jgi:hypothetical protein
MIFGGVEIWAQPAASLVFLGMALAVRRRGMSVTEGSEPNPPGRVAIPLLWASATWLCLEALNIPAGIWRYTLLPESPVVRGAWLALVWLPGLTAVFVVAWRGVREGATPRGSFLGAVGRHVGWALAWSAAVAAAGTAGVAGLRFNPIGPGGCVTGALVLAVAIAGAAAGAVGLMGGDRVANPPPGRGIWRDLATLVVVVLALQLGEASLSSTTPIVRDLPGILPSDGEALQLFGYATVTDLADASVDELVTSVPVLEEEQAAEILAAARLAMHGGMGTRWARLLWGQDVRSVRAVVGLDASDLQERLREGGATSVPEGWARAWAQGCGSFLAVEFRDIDFHP